MPIYAYRCATCGHAKDVLQKMSDPLLTICPSCGAATFVKQVTAAGFQLKGSGWYVTDFRGGDSAKPKPATGEEGQNGAAKGEPAGVDGAAKSDSAKTDTLQSAPAKSEAAPAAAPAPAPSTPPASGAK